MDERRIEKSVKLNDLHSGEMATQLADQVDIRQKQLALFQIVF
jgi:hypothetical protein